MKILAFIVGVFTGVLGLSALLLATEVVRAYKQNIAEHDPWNEFGNEER